mgnify:FL=1
MRPFYHVKPVSVRFYRMRVFNIFILTAEAAANHHEEHRYEEDSEYGCGNHTTHHACTNRVLRTGASTGADNQRQYAEDKRQ